MNINYLRTIKRRSTATGLLLEEHIYAIANSTKEEKAEFAKYQDAKKASGYAIPVDDKGNPVLFSQRYFGMKANVEITAKGGVYLPEILTDEILKARQAEKDQLERRTTQLMQAANLKPADIAKALFG